MYKSVHYTDRPLLLSRGFRCGIADTIMWGVDKNKNEWQVIIDDGCFAMFGKRLKKGNVNSHKRMTVAKFRELFTLGVE